MEKLLDYFRPEHYKLELCIFRDKEYIQGTTRISGEIAGDIVKFHAVDLDIKEVTFEAICQDESEDGDSALIDHKNDEYQHSCEYKYDGSVLEIDLDDKMEEVLAAFRNNASDRSLASFTIKYETQLNHNMQGCYVSTYDYNGEEQKLIATQFESHYAREAFPCIDEPGAKATFSLALIVPDHKPTDVVLANTSAVVKDNTRFEFAKTPRMSTYLLAWVVGPLKSVSTVNDGGVEVTSYCALNQPTDSLTFANDTAAKALDYYDREFGIKYPLSKLDQVALPDFEAGAMENWGLVTYRESCMLADPSSAIDTKQSVAVTVTHELSHQWFGDLVTMAWWDDLWLNESFATMMEFYATDALYPEFNIWQDFFTGDCLAALRRDSLPGVQAVQQAVHHPSEIATLFDSAIVYAKGARLMLMLRRLMGDIAFNQGINAYFKKYQYNNTVGDDLWSSLQPFADFDIKSFMHAWISQPGYPELHLSPDSHEVIEQHRFLIDGSTDDTTWPLPEVFDDMSGHYLINLSSADFEKKLTDFDRLSLEQRLRLLIDRSILAKTPAVPSSSLLPLIEKFSGETSAPIWSILSSIIGDLKIFCPPETLSSDLYRDFLRRTLSSRFAEIDLDDLSGDANATKLRDALINIAIYVRDADVLANLNQRYSDDVASLNPELRSAILTAHLFADEASAFPHYLKQYQSTSDPELRADLLFVLASFAEQPEHLDRLIALLSEPKIVRPQDHIFLYIYMLRNYHTRLRTIDWMTSHWSYIEKLTGDKSIEDYPRYAAALIRSPEEAEHFYTFFDQKLDDPILKRTLKMAHVEIDSRLDLIESDSAAVKKQLANLAKGK